MSTTRIFGAIRGAGVQVREVQPAKPIQEGPIGSTVVVGMFRSGPVGEVIDVDTGLPMFRRVFGGITMDSEAPLGCEHFYAMSGGHGRLYVQRITDGSEVAADLTLYDRKVDTSVCERREARRLPTGVIGLVAHNGGAWGGRRAVKTGDLGTLSGDITGTGVIDLSFSTLADKWKGATLTFPNDDSGAEFTVVSNTAAGVFTISGDFTAAVYAGTDGRFQLELVNTDDLTDGPVYLAIEVKDDPANGDKFSLVAWRDGSAVKSWESVGLASGGDAYWKAAIDDDPDNYEVGECTDNFTGDPTDDLARPANFAEIPAPDGVAANVVTFQVVRWTVTGTGTPYLDTINDVTWGSDPRGATLVLTFTAATTFTVACTYDDGEAADDLPGGTLGTAWASPNAYLPGFTARAGTVAAIAGTVLTIYVRPLPADLSSKGAYLYPAAASSEGDTNVRYRVVDNDHDSVTLLPSVDVSSEISAPTAPSMTGSLAGTFDLSGAGLTFIYSVGLAGSLDGPYTLTETLAGAATTATATAAELNALELARAGSAAAKLVEFSVSATDHLVVTALQDFGDAATLTLGAGTLNTILGFTTSQSATGAAGTICRLQWRQELGGGYDGISGVDSDDYVDAWDTSNAGPLYRLLERNTGVLRAIMPGVTDAAAQGAMLTWAYTTNGVAFLEIPDTVVTASAAIAWHKANIADEDVQPVSEALDYGPTYWPTYGKISSPYGAGYYTTSMLGAIMGLTARKAGEAEGYHLAPAGDSFLLSPLFKDLTTGDEVIDNELVNAYGLIEVRKRGAKIKLWGDRIPGNGWTPFLHKRLSMSHIGRTLLTNTTSLVFSAISTATFAKVKALLRGLFGPWFRRGWFSDADGPAFEDAVSIKVDASNNPKAERELGNLHADCAFEIVDTGERVIFQIGPKGVSETT